MKRMPLKSIYLVSILFLIDIFSIAQADSNAFSLSCEAAIMKRVSTDGRYIRLDAATIFERDIKGDNAKYVLPSLDCDGNPAAYNASRDCSGQPNAVSEASGRLTAFVRFYVGASRLKVGVCSVRVPSEDAVPVFDSATPVSISDVQ